MNIIIVGCGKVGETLAGQLIKDDNNITVIDRDADKVNELTARLDIMGVVGNGATHATQAEAGIADTDLLIAVTGSDELNLLCCMLAKKGGNCQTIARIKNPEYSVESGYLKDELGLAMVINPDQAAAAEIARVLRFPSAIKIDTFARGRVELLKFRLPEDCPLVGMAVKDVVSRLGCDVLVCTVERGEEAFITKGDFVFAERDIISIIASPKNAAAFFKRIGYKMRSVKDVMIVGGGEIAQYLSAMLRKTGVSVKIIEKDRFICEELCIKLPDVQVVHGDAADQSLLLEEGIENAGAFLALTGLDEENIILSLFAKRVGKGKVVTKINRIDFNDVISQLDLDSTIYPKNITADGIVRYVRAMKNSLGSNMETLYKVIKDKVEAAEFIVKEKSPVVGIPLMKLSIRKDALIAAIIREEGRETRVMTPRGSDTIEAGDRIVVVSHGGSLDDLSDILQ